MEILGLHYIIWLVVILYFAAMLLLGWWSKKGIHNQEGFLMGNRRFGVSMMIMHAFGAGTNPGDVAGVMSKTVSNGASGIWVSWMWMFGTPFYWLIAPIVRRMRCLTLADFFQERYGKSATFVYVVLATVGMIVFLASALLATTRTVQGMMGKATTTISIVQSVDDAANPDAQVVADDANDAIMRTEEAWFFGILFFTTLIFVVYGYWGGIVAAVRTDMVQGLMIIVLSFLAIPAAINLPQVMGLEGMRRSLAQASALYNKEYLSLFDPKMFNFWTVILLCINAPISMLSQPHLMTVCGAGKTEWEGRMGFCYGNILKRICTMGWCILGLCWLTYLLMTGVEIHPDAAFGDSVRELLNPFLQGLMLACVMAAAMSSGDAIQVTVAGLFSQNIYKQYLRPEATEKKVLQVTRLTGLFVVGGALLVAVLGRGDLVKVILDYFNIMSFLGITTAMGLLWRRMNTGGMLTSTIMAAIIFVMARYYFEWPRNYILGFSMAGGIIGGVIGSLLTPPPRAEVIDKFFTKIYVPIGEEEKLGQPLDQVVPVSQRWLTAGGMFIVKPSRQSWVGFLVALGICIACVLVMLLLLNW